MSRKSVRKETERQYWKFMFAAFGIIVVMCGIIAMAIYLDQGKSMKQVEHNEDSEWVASASVDKIHKEKVLEEQIIKETKKHRLAVEQQKQLTVKKVQPTKHAEQRTEQTQENATDETDSVVDTEVNTDDTTEDNQVEAVNPSEESTANSELHNVAADSENNVPAQEPETQAAPAVDPSENGAPILKEAAPVTDAEPAYSLPIQLFMLDQNTGENIGPNGVLDGNLGELWRLKKPKEVDLSTGEKMLLVRAVQEVTYLDGHTETIELNPFEDTYGKFDGSYTDNTIYMYYEDQLAPHK